MMGCDMMNRQRLASPGGLFEREDVRRVEYEGAWYYAVIDLVRALGGSSEPEQYWLDLKRREPEIGTMAELLEYPTGDGETQLLEMVTVEGALRLIQAIPSAKAERIKQWLAESGKRRLEEWADPELAILRTTRLYQQRGRSRSWVDKRLRGVSARHELTSEWRRRGMTDSEQYRSLTNELMQAAFGMDVNAYRRQKNLARPGENLRDHMTDLELVLTTLGETMAAELHRDRRSAGLEALLADTRDAGRIAAHAREEIEQQRAGHNARVDIPIGEGLRMEDAQVSGRRDRSACAAG